MEASKKEMTVKQPIQHTTGSTGTPVKKTPAPAQQTGTPGQSTPVLPDLFQFLGLGGSTINFQDIAIRAGLVIVGVLLLLIVVFRWLEKPAVEVATTAAKEGA